MSHRSHCHLSRHHVTFLFHSLFVLGITVIFQLLIQRDIEKIVGWWRMAIIYLGGGVVGSLASAIFLPYHVEVNIFKLL